MRRFAIALGLATTACAAVLGIQSVGYQDGSADAAVDAPLATFDGGAAPFARIPNAHALFVYKDELFLTDGAHGWHWTPTDDAPAMLAGPFPVEWIGGTEGFIAWRFGAAVKSMSRSDDASVSVTSVAGAITVAGDALLFLASNYVDACPLGAKCTTPRAMGQYFGASQLAPGTDVVYFDDVDDAGATHITSCSLMNGCAIAPNAPNALAPGSVHALSSNAYGVYWIEGQGDIVAAATDLSARSVAATGQSDAANVTGDDTHLYWTTTEGVVIGDRSGRQPVIVPWKGAAEVRVVGPYVVWIDAKKGDLVRMKRP
jgi:hypothetical protein